MRTRFATALIALLTATAITACDDGRADLSPDDAVAGNEVDVIDNRFEPAVLAIEPGDTVTWTWQGENPHDVVGDQFESDIRSTGTFTHIFEDPGEYAYVCTIHPGMEGLIVVAEE
jgi:plastocyanin